MASPNCPIRVPHQNLFFIQTNRVVKEEPGRLTSTSDIWTLLQRASKMSVIAPLMFSECVCLNVVFSVLQNMHIYTPAVQLEDRNITLNVSPQTELRCVYM